MPPDGNRGRTGARCTPGPSSKPIWTAYPPRPANCRPCLACSSTDRIAIRCAQARQKPPVGGGVNGLGARVAGKLIAAKGNAFFPRKFPLAEFKPVDCLLNVGPALAGFRAQHVVPELLGVFHRESHARQRGDGQRIFAVLAFPVAVLVLLLGEILEPRVML